MSKPRFFIASALGLLFGFAIAACGGSLLSSAIAGDAVAAPDGPGLVDLLTPVYQAFAGHHPALGLMLLIVVAVAALKHYLGDQVPFLHSDAGGSLLALVTASASAAAVALAVPGAVVSLDLLESALLVGVSAAGGYAMIKNILIDPLLPKLPLWAQTLLAPVLWIFTKSAAGSAATLANATTAGNTAVESKPAVGATGIVGSATEVK